MLALFLPKPLATHARSGRMLRAPSSRSSKSVTLGLPSVMVPVLSSTTSVARQRPVGHGASGGGALRGATCLARMEFHVALSLQMSLTDMIRSVLRRDPPRTIRLRMGRPVSVTGQGTVWTWCAVSRARPPLMRTPFCAPTPVPTSSGSKGSKEVRE